MKRKLKGAFLIFIMFVILYGAKVFAATPQVELLGDEYVKTRKN